MPVNFPIPPTFADPVIYDENTKKQQFNPLWLRWFLDLAQAIVTPAQHNSLAGLQGGDATSSQYYHLTKTIYDILKNLGTPTAGGVAYGTGATVQFTAAGSAGQPLLSNGTGIPVFGTLGTGAGGTGLTSYAVGDIIYCNATNTLTKLTKPTSDALLRMTSAGAPSWKIPAYGAFHDTTNQTAAANTPTAITYNSTDFSANISVGTPTSRIVVATAGLYNIQFSIQLANTSATIDDVAVWLRVNGTDVANSTSWVAMPTKHGAVNGQLILALNVFYQFAANDYFQLVWMTVNGTSSIETIAGSTGTPAYPASPGVILTVSDNIAA